jgi:hypothetical protein
MNLVHAVIIRISVSFPGFGSQRMNQLIVGTYVWLLILTLRVQTAMNKHARNMYKLKSKHEDIHTKKKIGHGFREIQAKDIKSAGVDEENNLYL